MAFMPQASLSTMKAVSAGNNSQRGNSALEILIALAILTMAMTAIVQVAFSNQTVSTESQVNSEALSKSTLGLEKARAAARENFAAVISSSSTDDIYLKELTVTDLTQCRKRVVSRVSWATDPSRPEYSELTSDVTDIALGGDCASVVTEKTWSSPTTLGSIDLGQSKATGIDVRHGIVFLSAEATSAAKPDFFIVDAKTDPPHPVILSSLDTGPSLAAVDVAGHYAYVANRDNNGQLQVIDVADTAHPVLAAARDLPGVGGGNPEGNTIAYYNSRVYIGTKSTAGHELHIFDVTNPTSPTNIGHIEMGRNVNGIFVRGTTAYVAVGSSAGDLKDLVALDVTNPGLITELWSLNLPGGGGKSVYIVGTKLYIGCFQMSGAQASQSDLYIYDISGATPTLLGSKNIGADVSSIRVAGSFAFLATNDSNREFQVWNITNPAVITQVSYLNFPQEAIGVDYENETIYAGVRSNDSLRIIISP